MSLTNQSRIGQDGVGEGKEEGEVEWNDQG